MKRFISASLLAISLSQSANAALPEGATAPNFTAQASLAGKAFDYSLQTALKQGPVVVYFYPSAYTGGCNIQAHEFSANQQKFAAAGASIIGVSLDSLNRLNDFSADADYCAGKVAVASDADGKITQAYQLNVREAVAGKKDTRGIEINHGFAERTTFIVTPDGKIAAVLSGLPPAINVAKSLEVVQRLHDANKSDNW